MTSTKAAPITLDRISLRKAERGFVVGGVGTGKSTLMDLLGADFVHRYAAAGARRLILDSKPRYRAQYTATGASAAGRYKRWSHGKAIPGSVVVDDPRDMRLAWETGARTVIVQCESANELPRLVLAARMFLTDSRASRPQLVQVDETLDFFHSNGSPRGGDDTIVMLGRAGRERGTAVLYGAQRTKGFPATLLSEMMRLYALRIDYAADAKRLAEMGAPPFELPRQPHQFIYWYKGDYDHVYGPYRLSLDAS